MDAAITIVMLVPVLLAVALIINVIRKNVTERQAGDPVDISGAIPAVIVLMVAVLIIAAMGNAASPYVWDEDSGELTIKQNVGSGSQDWDSYGAEVKSLVINGNVTTVADGAFDTLTGLEYLRISDSVESITSSAFGVTLKDYSGATITAPEAGDYLGSGDGTLYYADTSIFTFSTDGQTVTGLVSGAAPTVLAIPSANIGTAAFRGNTSATVLYMNPNTETVGNSAFRDMTALTAAILKEAEYGTDLFRGCTSLADVDFYEGITEIPSGAFAQCSALDIALPTTLTVINGSAFNASGIVTVDMPNVKEIGASAFYNCTSMTSLTMPSIKSIAAGAFTAVRITSLEIPASLTTIGENAFRSVTTITSVSFASGFDGTFSDSMPNWTFYDSDGTTVLAKTAANMAGYTFQGTNTALVKVAPGQLTLTPQQLQQVQLHTQEAQDLDIQPLPFQPSVQTQDQEPVSA